MIYKNIKRNYAKKERSYRFSVILLAFILVIIGIVLLFMILPWPVKYLTLIPLPFIESGLLKKYVLVFTALLHILFGIGLLLRSRLLWHMFLAYLFLGPAWLILGMICDHFPALGSKTSVMTVSLLAWAGMGMGLYFLTKPAFISGKKR